MKKSLFLLILICFGLATLVMGGCGQESETGNNETGSNEAAEVNQDPVELNFVSAYVDAHPTTINAFKPWEEKAGQLSNGLLTIQHYAPNTLCPEKEAFDSAVGGFVDIGSGFNGYFPGKFTYSEVMELPLIVKSSESGSLVMMELLEKFPALKEQYSEAELLWMWVSATYNLHTVDKEVRTLEDLKGMKIIGWSPKILQMLKLLGANPLEMVAVDTYMALERGMADGVLCPLAPVKSYKISDIAKYHTIIDLSVGPFFSVMNKEKYAGLPEYAKKIIDDTTGVEMARQCGITLDQGAVADSKWMMENGHNFYVIPDDEREKWVQAVTPMWDEWVVNAEKGGLSNAREVLEAAVELGKKYDAETGRGFVQ